MSHDRHREPQTERAQPELKDGRVVAIAGPVVDVEFPPDALPEINTALEMDVELEGETITIIAEVAQQIGEGRCRAICMKPTDGLRRGTLVAQPRSRHPDAGRRRRARPRVQRHRRAARHRTARRSPRASTTTGRSTATSPPFDQLEPKAQMFETGIKVIDLLEPYVQGGKIGLFGGAGRRQDGADPGDDQPGRHPARWRVRVRRRRRAHP